MLPLGTFMRLLSVIKGYWELTTYKPLCRYRKLNLDLKIFVPRTQLHGLNTLTPRLWSNRKLQEMVPQSLMHLYLAKGIRAPYADMKARDAKRNKLVQSWYPSPCSIFWLTQLHLPLAQ
ncbi:hypothetical protein L1987_83942 [Smallanthus sonchifolius]|uniref:Uncharacterized protein n=1 Tax=Smallanthus sonchifolius TaxID=185202 RepID=A0ACB8YCK6_9ASTR|nr:hypothetical protein L1987_83942 [Smallanthus sonchifolius]